MRRWIAPLIVGLVVAFAAYHAALLATPRFLMSAAMRRISVAGVNRMLHAPLATDQARAIVRPSPDLAYSSCPLDLAGGPVAVHVAAAPSPYWSLSVFDQDTNVTFVRNNGETGGQPLDLVIARPGQRVPAGREVVRVDGAKGIALIRILVEDRTRFAAIDAARQQSGCHLL